MDQKTPPHQLLPLKLQTWGVRFGGLLLGLTLLASCGSKSKDSGSPEEDLLPGSSVGGASVPNTVALDFAIKQATGAKSGGLALTYLDSGHTNRAEILSLKYYLTNISICQDAEINGSGYSNPKGCIALYTNSKLASQYDQFGPLDAENSAHDQDYVDLLQGFKGSIKLDSSSVGRYKYALVNWMKPIKVTASAHLNGFMSPSLFTRKGAYETSVDANGVSRMLTRVTKLNEGPASEAIVTLNNGGSVFAFQSPLVITDEDISSNAAYTMDIVFNPEGLLKAYRSTSTDISNARAATMAGASIVSTPESDGGNGETLDQVEVPMISLVPLVHKTTETLVKETYKIRINSGLAGKLNGTSQSGGTVNTPFDVRVELYYIGDAKGDFNPTQPIYAASLTSLIRYRTNDSSATTEKYIGSFPNIHGLALGASTGELTLFDWRGEKDGAIVQGMKRLATEGASGTLTFACANGIPLIPGTLCYNSANQTYNTVTFTAPYTLESRVLLTDASANALGSVDSAVQDQAAATKLALTEVNSGWYGACIDTGNSTSSRRVIEFNPDRTMWIFDYYFTGTACNFANSILYYRALFGTYQIGSEVAPGINKFSFVKEHLFLAPTAASVQNFNTTNRCGYGGTDWVADTGYDIFGANCADAQGQGSAMDEVFGVLQRTGNTLYWFGTEAGKTGASPDSRITVIDANTPYTAN